MGCCTRSGCAGSRSGTFGKIIMSWQAEQLQYPYDAGYAGAKIGLFDPSEYGKKIVGEPNAGATFIYLFRRFGYPRFGWDGDKTLVSYSVTTPMAGVVLKVEPNVTGGGTFGYLLREDIDQACEAEERKPYEDWIVQFEAWTMKEYGIEVVRLFDQDNDKLNRMWKVWGADKEASDYANEKDAQTAFFTDQEKIRVKYTKMYEEIAQFPDIVPIDRRPDDSIMKQCQNALRAAIKDMLRPVYVRDVMIDINGEIIWERNMAVVKCAEVTGCGVGAWR